MAAAVISTHSHPGLIAVTDQKAPGRIALLDLGADLRSEPAVIWRWSPAGLSGWGRPTDVRLRRHARSGVVMIVSDSYGAVAAVSEDETIVWSMDLGPLANPHAAELVDGTLIAVACSTGGTVKTYDTTTPTAEWEVFDLPGAHGLVWDARDETLWALGATTLIGLRRNGGSAEWQTWRSHDLPSTGGHDLSWAADRDRLIVTTESAVHVFVMNASLWMPAEGIGDRARVKSLDEHPDSRHVVMTVPDDGRDPDWLTSTLLLRDVDGTLRSAAVDASVYKARHWSVR